MFLVHLKLSNEITRKSQDVHRNLSQVLQQKSPNRILKNNLAQKHFLFMSYLIIFDYVTCALQV